MKTPLIAALLAAAAASAALPAAAQAPQNVNGRQTEQTARINQGVRTGELTPRETRHVEHQQVKIARTEARMRARHGGQLTERNHAKLARMQNHASRTIYRAKHNARVG